MPDFWYVWMIAAFALSVLATPLAAFVARRFGAVNEPKGEPKQIHKQAIPQLGGTAIFSAIALTLAAAYSLAPVLTSGLIGFAQYNGFLLGGLVLVLGGTLDDRYNLPPRLTILFPLIAAFIAVACGIGVSKVSNPFGSTPFEIAGIASQIITFVWLLVVMYTTKFLDGLDGLATGVSSIGALMMMCLALTVAYFQPDAALFASICLGAMLGFLVWNFNPAKIFLGEGGSTFVGFTIGVLAVIGGGKLGTALLVLSIPFLDVVWVILRRTIVEHHSPTKGDRKHLHHRLLDLGLSQRQVVLLYYAIATSVGLVGLFLQSRQKLILFGLIALAMFIFALLLVARERKRR